jgi:regulator of protease activity HflC (stomatin/prohibitin superfamily)
MNTPLEPTGPEPTPPAEPTPIEVCRVDPVEENPFLYRNLVFIGLLLIVVLMIIAIPTWNKHLFDDFDQFNMGPTFLVLALMYLCLSAKDVGANQYGGAYSYGMALTRLKSGLKFIPFGLMQLRIAPREVQEFQCPGEPEQVFKGDDAETLPPGMVRPIRAVTRAPTAEETGLLDVQMTLVLNFVVQWQVNDIFSYVANFNNNPAQVEKQLRDIGEIVLAEEATRYTPNGFITALPTINKRLVKENQGRFQNSGVEIVSTRLISPDVSHGVSSALADIPVARAEAQQAMVRAEGERVKRTKEGEGTAAAALALLTAQADGRGKMMGVLKVGGDAVLASEAVASLSNKTVILAGAKGGMRDVMGLVTGAQLALKATGSTQGEAA